MKTFLLALLMSLMGSLLLSLIAYYKNVEIPFGITFLNGGICYIIAQNITREDNRGKP